MNYNATDEVPRYIPVSQICFVERRGYGDAANYCLNLGVAENCAAIERPDVVSTRTVFNKLCRFVVP